MRRLGFSLLTLFPRAWRDRYEAEMRDLLAEQTIRPRTVVDLVRAAADAHLHPDGLMGPASERMGNTVGAALCCWIAFIVCGAAFAKLTEDRLFATAGAAHPLLGGARMAIELLAAVSVIVVLLGGARLIIEVVREAWIQRRPALVRAASAPLAAVIVFAAATGAVAWLSSGGHVQPHSAGAWVAVLVWFAIGLGGAAVCGLAARSALRLARPRTAALRAGVRGAAVVTIVLALMTTATALYMVAVAVEVPSLAQAATGPLGLVSTTAALAVVTVAMAMVTGLAAITSARGLRAAVRPVGREDLGDLG